MIRIGTTYVDPNPTWQQVQDSESQESYYDKVSTLIGDHPISEDAAKSVYQGIIYAVEQKKAVSIDGLAQPTHPINGTYGQFCDISAMMQGNEHDLVKLCAVYCQHGYSEKVTERLLNVLPNKPFAQIVGTGEMLLEKLSKLNELRERQLYVPSDAKTAQAYEGAYKGLNGQKDIGLIVYSRLFSLSGNDLSKMDYVRALPYAEVYQAEKAQAETQKIEQKIYK